MIVTHSERILRRLPFNKLIVCHKEKQELFPDGYDEFLEKVGWQEEGKKAPEKAKPAAPSAPKKTNKWAVKSCEDKIVVLEESLKKNNEKLAAIAHKGEGGEIKKLIALIEEEQKQIDELFRKLEELTKDS